MRIATNKPKCFL